MDGRKNFEFPTRSAAKFCFRSQRDNLAWALRSRRREIGMSVAELSALTGVSESAIRRFERCESNPMLVTLIRLSVGVGLGYDKLFKRAKLYSLS